MRTTIIVILFFILSNNLYGQVDFPVDVKTNKITYKDFVENEYDSIQNKKIIENLLKSQELFSEISDNDNNGKLIINAKGKIPVYFYYKKYSTKKRSSGNVNYDLSFLILNNKVGYKFTNFVHKNGKVSGGPLEKKSGGWSVATSHFNGFKEQTNDYIKSLIKEIQLSLKNKELNEEW